MLHIPGLYIADSLISGRGVYCGLDIGEGDIIEICPIIKIPNGQIKAIDPTILYEYYFLWEEEGYEACLALGYGSLYNHAENPFAQIIMDYTDDTIKVEAIKDIPAHEEITIDYTGGTKGLTTLWF